MMFEVVLHVPVIKRRYPRASKGACIHTEVRNVGIQSVVLWQAAEKSKPTAIKRAKSEYDHQEPMTCEYEDRSKRSMTE